MYNARDTKLNAQININEIMDRIMETEIIINEILFYYIIL